MIPKDMKKKLGVTWDQKNHRDTTEQSTIKIGWNIEKCQRDLQKLSVTIQWKPNN